MLKTENGQVLWSPETPGVHTIELRGESSGQTRRLTIDVVEPPPGWNPADGVPPAPLGDPTNADMRVLLGGPPVPIFCSTPEFTVAPGKPAPASQSAAEAA